MYREKLEKLLFSREQNILSQMQKVHFLCFFSGTIDFLIIAQCKKNASLNWTRVLMHTLWVRPVVHPIMHTLTPTTLGIY